MSEENEEKDSDWVKPLEVKPGGKEKGTRILVKAGKEVNEDKK